MDAMLNYTFNGIMRVDREGVIQRVNRAAVAAELGISKTTLWRYVKKYGIEKDFSY